MQSCNASGTQLTSNVWLNDMKITFDLSEADYKTFFRFHYSRFRIIKFRLYYGTAMVMIGLYLSYSFDDHVRFFPLLLIIFGFYFLFSKSFYIRKALLASRTNPTFKNTIEVDIGDDGIKWKGKNTNGEFKWSALLGYREFEHGFLLYPQKNLFYMIPAKALGDIEKQKLTSILNEKLKKI